jgi:Dyp-type peroxidase family
MLMSYVNDVREQLPDHVVTVELDDIQATVLRSRPAPYFGTHLFLRIDDATAGREFLQKTLPYVASAANWWQARDAWASVALTYAGLEALEVPQSSLRSFPELFRQGMASRATQVADVGVNGPEYWERPFGTGEIHLGVSIFSDSVPKWHKTRDSVQQQLQSVQGVTLLSTQEFGAQPGDRNSFGYRDLISQPAVEGSGVPPLPGQGRPIKAGEFILGYPGEAGVNRPMPQPELLGRNGTYVGIRKYQSRVGAFNRFLLEHAQTPEERELLAAKLVGRWRSGAPLTLAPESDEPTLGADPQRNNDFTYADDPHGRCVPLGAHMRRVNPRDTELPVLTDVNLHRIIRRGTTYGTPYDPEAISTGDDEVPRGVFFIFLSSNAMETFEFLQREWIQSGNFTGLGDERDPVAGLQQEGATFTIPKQPVRCRVSGIETFNVLRGGEYLFMPGLAALKWLAEPGGSADGSRQETVLGG